MAEVTEVQAFDPQIVIDERLEWPGAHESYVSDLSTTVDERLEDPYRKGMREEQDSIYLGVPREERDDGVHVPFGVLRKRDPAHIAEWYVRNLAYHGLQDTFGKPYNAEYPEFFVHHVIEEPQSFTGLRSEYEERQEEFDQKFGDHRAFQEGIADLIGEARERWRPTLERRLNESLVDPGSEVLDLYYPSDVLEAYREDEEKNFLSNFLPF